jgi:hypothetical protein
MKTATEINKIVKEIETSKDLLVPIWASISKWLMPEACQFFAHTKKDKEYQIDINKYREHINMSPYWALKTAASGIMNALMPENKKWFALKDKKNSLYDYSVAKKIENYAYPTISKDGFYSLGTLAVKELNAFGNFLVRKNFTKDGLKFIKFPLGSYSIGSDIYGEVDKISVKYEYQIYEFKKEFKTEVPLKYRNKKETEIIFFHTLLIKNLDKTKDDKGVTRDWIEYHICDNTVFKTAGYVKNPYTYCQLDKASLYSGWGIGSGIRSLATIKSIQSLMLEFCNALEKHLNPAAAYDVSVFENGNVDLEAGARNAISRSNGDISKCIANLGVQDINFQVFQYMLDKFENMVNRCLDADIFLSVSGAGKQMTAYEAAIIETEKTLRMGSISSNITSQYTIPMLQNYADYYYYVNGYAKQDEIETELYGYMALVQKMQDLQNLTQGLGIIGNLAQLAPQIINRINADKIPEKIVRLLNLDDDFLVSPQEAAQKSADMQRALAQEEQARNPQNIEPAANLAQPTGGLPNENIA